MAQTDLSCCCWEDSITIYLLTRFSKSHFDRWVRRWGPSEDSAVYFFVRLLRVGRDRAGPVQEHAGPGRRPVARRTHRKDLVLVEVRTVDGEAAGVAAQSQESAVEDGRNGEQLRPLCAVSPLGLSASMMESAFVTLCQLKFNFSLWEGAGMELLTLLMKIPFSKRKNVPNLTERVFINMTAGEESFAP